MRLRFCALLAADGTMQPDYSYPLSEATPGQQIRVCKVGDEPSTLLPSRALRSFPRFVVSAIFCMGSFPSER